MAKTKKFTILHSNDMHGDFFAEAAEHDAGGETGALIGGLALLSGYIDRVRAEEENVLYVISGDMVQGNIIDTEYKGASTIEIMNYLAPDVAALGNHELDYGLPHLLFLEKLANFPIVNANMYVKQPTFKRLMRPHHIIRKAGFDILFTGILTDKVMDSIRLDELIGSFVTLEEAAGEVGRICGAYKNADIDLTVLLTHIGFQSDCELAKLLDAEWGVDMIIGGHSHTMLEAPAEVNGVLISQAGVGTNQVGRYDITVDDDTNSILEYRWQLVPIESSIAEPDQRLIDYIDSFKKVVDKKYSTVVCKLTEPHTHPRREVETALGNLVADALAELAETDVMLLGAGSVRVDRLGPVITRMDLMGCFPFDDSLTRITVTGEHLARMFAHWMRTENRSGEGECYQVNSTVRAAYDDAGGSLAAPSPNARLAELAVHAIPIVREGSIVADPLEIPGVCDPGKAIIPAEQRFTVTLQGYHLSNMPLYLDVALDEVTALGRPEVVATSAQAILEEWLANNQNVGRKVEGRLVYR